MTKYAASPTPSTFVTFPALERCVFAVCTAFGVLSLYLAPEPGYWSVTCEPPESVHVHQPGCVAPRTAAPVPAPNASSIFTIVNASHGFGLPAGGGTVGPPAVVPGAVDPGVVVVVPVPVPLGFAL